MARISFPAALAISLAGLALASCASLPTSASSRLDKKLDVVTSNETAGMDPIASAAFWGTRFDREPNDPKVVASFSRALRAIGNDAESLRVVQTAEARIGDDPDLLLEMGKSLIANDRAYEAIRPLQAAIALGKDNDWTALSALGVAHDRIGEHRQALIQYDRALTLSPGQSQVLNNKGLSYALAGRRDLAERTLRTATSLPGGTSQVRQNYALVLALSGKTQEAERLARSDLPPAIADGNVAFYRSLVSQPAYWQGLDTSNAVQPDFGDTPQSGRAPRATPVMEPGGPSPAKRPAPTPSTPPKSNQTKPTPAASASAAQTGSGAVAANGEPVKLPFTE